MKKIQVGHLSGKHLKKLRRLQRHRLTIFSRRATILILSHQDRRWDLFKPKPHPGRKPTFDDKVQRSLIHSDRHELKRLVELHFEEREVRLAQAR